LIKPLAITIYRWYSYQVVILVSDLHEKQIKKVVDNNIRIWYDIKVAKTT